MIQHISSNRRGTYYRQLGIAGYISTSDVVSLTPYTISETMIHIPYTMVLTDDTPFVEQIDSISDISGNVVVMQSGTAEDRAPPTLVSVTSASTSSITITFSEPISAQSANIDNYNLLGTTIRNIGSGTEDRTVIISTSTFIDATLQIPITAMIEDTSGNVLQDGATQPVVKNR